MWPFSNMSLSAATLWSDVANLALLLSLLAGVISTFAIVRLANVKEHHWDEERRVSAEKIAALQTDTAKANARAAEALQKAEEERLARVKVEEKIAPRRLSSAQQTSLAAKLAKWANRNEWTKQVAFVAAIPDSHEGTVFANDILYALKAAGWDTRASTSGMTGTVKGVSGVVVRTSSNPLAIAVAHALVEALAEERVLASVLPEKARGCEEEGRSKDYMDKEPACSMIQVIVADHP